MNRSTSDSSLTDIARQINEGKQARGSLFRQAKLTGLTAGPPRLATLDIGGTTVSGVRLLDHVNPTLNEGVWFMDIGEGRWLIVGTNGGALTRAEYVKAAGDTMTGLLTINAGGLTVSGGAVTLSSTSAPQLTIGVAAGGTNRIEMPNTSGVAAPTVNPTAQSAGMKLVLYTDRSSAGRGDYGIGIDTSTLWNSVPTTSEQFRWYGGTTSAMTLTGAGVLTTASTITGTRLISTIATGTAPLSVSSTTMVTNLNAQFVGGVSKPDHLSTTSFTARTTTTTGTATAAMATLSCPAQTSAGVWTFIGTTIMSKTVATDAYDIGVSTDGATTYIAITRALQGSGLPVTVTGAVAVAANTAVTLTMHHERQAGTGTETNGSGDARFNRFTAWFIGN